VVRGAARQLSIASSLNQMVRLPQGSVVLGPVRYPPLLTGNMMAASGVHFVRHDRRPDQGTGPLLPRRPHPCNKLARATEVAIAVAVLNRMLDLGRPNSVRSA